MAKSRVLVVGTGGIGTMSAYALENGGLAEVTAVMRSNYDAAVKDGIDIDSVQYGQIKAWRPTASMWTYMRYENSLLTCPSHQDRSRRLQG
jgi:ketopantoate reductase